MKTLLFCLVLSFCYSLVICQEISEKAPDLKFIGRQLVEQGRTLVHHAVKRFMIILPAIFFKLGIAFTLLLVVTLVAVNNSFIGFLLLVVGLSSVLARLQETRRPALIPAPYISPLPPYHAHWDRSSDRNDDGQNSVTGTSYGSYNQQQYYSSYPGYTKTLGKLQ